MPSPSINIIIKVVVDFIVLIAVALPVLLFYLLGKPFQRGFFCNDETIQYPYKDSTVTTGVLYAFGTLIPLISILVVEFIHVWKGRIRSEGRERLQLWFWACYRYVGIFFFGCALSQLNVDICKYSIGRLRPHFIAVCQPDYSQVTCIDDVFITENICSNPLNTNEEVQKMKEARLSFMSGHASFSAFTMFYLIIYLQLRFRLHHFRLIRPFLQFLCFALTVYTCLTRVSDNKHHWSDVFAGFINGIVFAFFTSFAIVGLHCKKAAIHSSDMKMCTMNRDDERSVP